MRNSDNTFPRKTRITTDRIILLQYYIFVYIIIWFILRNSAVVADIQIGSEPWRQIRDLTSIRRVRLINLLAHSSDHD